MTNATGPGRPAGADSARADSSGADSPSLTAEERRTVSALGYLYLRLGLMDKARRAFEAVLALCPGDQAASRSLAAVEVRDGNGARALELLRESLGGPLSSKEAVLLLLKAGAYSLEGRSDEAALAADEYRRLSGGGR